MRTTFKELTWPCKIGIIGGWIVSIVYTIVMVSTMIITIIGD